MRAFVYRAVGLVPPELLRRFGRTRIGLRLQTQLKASGVLRIRTGPLAGILMDDGGTTPGYVLGTSQPAVQQALVEHLGAGDVLYDVGANVGFFTLLGARLVDSKGHVYAFEPVGEAAAILRENVEHNGFENVTVIEQAISDYVGQGRMTVADDLLWSALSENGGGLEVEVVTLDSLDLRPPTVIKIDVEGHETAVIRGMQETLNAHHPVLVLELHEDDAEAEIRSLLSGYECDRLNDGGGGGMQHMLARYTSAVQ